MARVDGLLTLNFLDLLPVYASGWESSSITRRNTKDRLGEFLCLGVSVVPVGGELLYSVAVDGLNLGKHLIKESQMLKA